MTAVQPQPDAAETGAPSCAHTRAREVQIAGTLRSRINRHAHASGQRHADEVRAHFLTMLSDLAARGAGFDELSAALDVAGL